MEAKVANLRANAQAQTSSEAKSSSDGGPTEAEIAAQVEAELQALEAADLSDALPWKKSLTRQGKPRWCAKTWEKPSNNGTPSMMGW